MMTIEFGNIGPHLATRMAGASIREKIVSAFENPEQIVFDFKGVETVTDSFADECFAKLIDDYELKMIKAKTTFKNTSPFIKSKIANAITERLVSK